jgi:hypothetical protein
VVELWGVSLYDDERELENTKIEKCENVSEKKKSF